MGQLLILEAVFLIDGVCGLQAGMGTWRMMHVYMVIAYTGVPVCVQEVSLWCACGVSMCIICVISMCSVCDVCFVCTHVCVYVCSVSICVHTCVHM